MTPDDSILDNAADTAAAVRVLRSEVGRLVYMATTDNLPFLIPAGLRELDATLRQAALALSALAQAGDALARTGDWEWLVDTDAEAAAGRLLSCAREDAGRL